VIETDVLIIGAGPAGATVALNLAPTHRVLLIEHKLDVATRVGESLVPAARQLLADMGLLASFEAAGHAPYFGNRSVWGTPTPVETDFLRDPIGHGWHLDRVRFDKWLRSVAVARGAQLLAPARIKKIQKRKTSWQAFVVSTAEPVVVKAKILIDACGRTAPFAHILGAHRVIQDRLVCGWICGRTRTAASGNGLTHVESTENGWWYSAPIPNQRRVLAFHTDADLPAASLAHSPNMLFSAAEITHEIRKILSECEFVPSGAHGFTAAHSTTLVPCCGPGWFAVGDAALSFDPLSSQGLLNALFTGLAAAEAVDRHFSGADDATLDYKRIIDDIAKTYRRHLKIIYGSERRWHESPFWYRRLNSWSI
jgi:flavin-dependent dehydrogenase